MWFLERQLSGIWRVTRVTSFYFSKTIRNSTFTLEGWKNFIEFFKLFNVELFSWRSKSQLWNCLYHAFYWLTFLRNYRFIFVLWIHSAIKILIFLLFFLDILFILLCWIQFQFQMLVIIRNSVFSFINLLNFQVSELFFQLSQKRNFWHFFAIITYYVDTSFFFLNEMKENIFYFLPHVL